jgi:hypothetical protein
MHDSRSGDFFVLLRSKHTCSRAATWLAVAKRPSSHCARKNTNFPLIKLFLRQNKARHFFQATACRDIVESVVLTGRHGTIFCIDFHFIFFIFFEKQNAPSTSRVPSSNPSPQQLLLQQLLQRRPLVLHQPRHTNCNMSAALLRQPLATGHSGAR